MVNKELEESKRELVPGGEAAVVGFSRREDGSQAMGRSGNKLII